MRIRTTAAAVALAVLLGTMALAPRAGAQIPKNIVNAFTGVTEGTIEFPGIFGETIDGVIPAGVKLDLASFDENQIMALSWELHPTTFAVVTLRLTAREGVYPCDSVAEHGPCSYRELNLVPEFSDLSDFSYGVARHSCPAPPPPPVPGEPTASVICNPVAVPSNLVQLVDPDSDGDGILDGVDNCPFDPNPLQEDTDGDGDGDACDGDLDQDGVIDALDACVPTAAGQVVDVSGCSIADLCPCGNDWKNRGTYVACTVKAAISFAKQGLITKREAVQTGLGSVNDQCGEAKVKSVLKKIAKIIEELDNL
jgi:hypothetical protein